MSIFSNTRRDFLKKIGLGTGLAVPAGIGAAIAAKKQCTPRSLDVTEIRSALTADGVNLDYGLKKS